MADYVLMQLDVQWQIMHNNYMFYHVTSFAWLITRL